MALSRCAVLLLAMVAAGCRREAHLVAETRTDAGAPVAQLGEVLPTGYVAATLGEAHLRIMGSQVGIFEKDALYLAGEDGRISMVLGVEPAFQNSGSPDMIFGNAPDDVWGLATHWGNRAATGDDLVHLENEHWRKVVQNIEAPRNVVATSRGAAAYLDGASLDTLMTVQGKKKQKSGLKSHVEINAMIGLLSGDIYASGGDKLFRISPKDPAAGVDVPLPEIPGHATKDLTLTDFDATETAPLVVALKAHDAGTGRPVSAVATLRDGAWQVQVCPFEDEIEKVAAAPDGALWAVTASPETIWRYVREWKKLSAWPNDGLKAAKLTATKVSDLAVLSAKDAWVIMGDYDKRALVHLTLDASKHRDETRYISAVSVESDAHHAGEAAK